MESSDILRPVVDEFAGIGDKLQTVGKVFLFRGKFTVKADNVFDGSFHP